MVKDKAFVQSIKKVRSELLFLYNLD